MALALSGGGDSVALLHLASDWARAHGRRLLALTVDHGLNSDSADWTRQAGAAARAAGADWRALVWTGDWPATGLSAAARTARHRLIADAAREAGARVVLFAHTAGDIAEADRMRTEGSTLGRLRDWSPSPVWPEGRGLMLLRPLLDARREDLRGWLRARDADWIEDPANADLRFARSRARRALAERPAATPTPMTHAPTSRGVIEVRDDVIRLARDADARSLAAALVCAGGGDRPPRGDRLSALRTRLATDETFAATLSGARLTADRDLVTVTREPGEFRRRAIAPVPLTDGVETVWDGRWAITPSGAGWSAGPAAGRLAALSGPDRARLQALPASARGARPVLIRHGDPVPVLAGTFGKAHALVGERLALALDRMTHERDLGGAIHGATPRNHLFSGADISE